MCKKATAFTGILIWFVYFSRVKSYANSSWHWVTTSPMNVFPIAVILMLLIESFAILKFAGLKEKDTKKVFLVITLANLLSFAAPYIYRAISFSRVLGIISISAAFNKGPYYIVMSGYLILTLIFELPVVYLFLRMHVKNKIRLALTIPAANVITTVLVAVLERLICVGQW